MRTLAVVLVALAVSTAEADVRSFTRTWEYSTVGEGHTTVDLWHTQAKRSFEQVLEIEHGITDAFDLALFTTFSQGDLLPVDGMTPSRSFGMRETRVTGRYRFVERAEWPVDTMVHLSAAKEFGVGVYQVEARLVGARDFDRLLVAANAAVSFEAGNDVDQTELVFTGAVGVSYEVLRTLRLGAEGYGTIASDVRPISAGPVASWFPTSGFWLAVGAGFGITDEADHFTVNAIIGLEL